MAKIHDRGSTWAKYLVYLILNNAKQDTLAEDFDKTFRLEFHLGSPEEELLKSYRESPPPRQLTTHMPVHFLEKQVTHQKVKVIVMMRNPKDTLVSYYHFYTMMEPLGSFAGTWDEFFEMFKQKHLFGGDVFQFNLGWWKARHNPNVCIQMYEDAKQDLDGTVRKVARFLNKELSDDIVNKIVEEASFVKMKNNPAVNAFLRDPNVKITDPDKFMRKGAVGDWRSLFSAEQAKYVDDLCADMFQSEALFFKE